MCSTDKRISTAVHVMRSKIRQMWLILCNECSVCHCELKILSFSLENSLLLCFFFFVFFSFVAMDIFFHRKNYMVSESYTIYSCQNFSHFEIILSWDAVCTIPFSPPLILHFIINGLFFDLFALKFKWTTNDNDDEPILKLKIECSLSQQQSLWMSIVKCVPSTSVFFFFSFQIQFSDFIPHASVQSTTSIVCRKISFAFACDIHEYISPKRLERCNRICICC